MIVLVIIISLLTITALLPPLIVVLSAYPGPFFVSFEGFVGDYSGTLISLGTLFLVSLLAVLASHLANVSAEKRILHETDQQRRLKLSEYRRIWLDELRDELAQVIGMCAFRSEINGGEKKQFLALIAKLQLRIHSSHQYHDEFIETLRAIATSQEEGKDNPITPADMITLSEKVLKEEWEQLKIELSQVKPI